MKNKCENCGKCCLETEMILSQQDIKIIISNLPNIKRQDFTFKNINEQYQLKNIEGHCFFFDFPNRECKIYKLRPQGCRFYPLIYDFNKKDCRLDDDCPRNNLFYNDNKTLRRSCQNLKSFLKTQLNIKLN
jgi:Fe-S-cluster containining protein